MAFNWQKLFENWTWHNRTQSKDTPINATNLNKINNAIDGIDNRVVAVGEALDELVFEDVTVSGNPAVFESRSEQLSKQTTVNIEPIQDLHGYDKPWIGGAGKNKLPLTVEGLKATNTSGTWSGNQYVKNGITFTVITDENNNVTGIKANGTASGGNAEIRMYTETYASNKFKGYKLTGSTGGSGNTFAMITMYSNNGTSWANEARQYDGEDLTISDYNYIRFAVIISNGKTVSNQMFYPMVRLATESDATFAPYTNICPISGLDSVDVTVADAQTSPTTSQTYTTTLPTTVYGGTLDLTNGRLVVDRAYIASYSGQTLPGAWISDRDVYTGSNSPTTGAQVVYELATHVMTTITPSSLSLLKGLNVVSTNGDTVEVTFNDPVSHDDLDGKLDKTDVATVEGDKASRAYSVNEFMLRSDGFYRVTAPIASGASITSSNTTKTTIGAVLTALLNS
jgi:hypothetical protein